MRSSIFLLIFALTCSFSNAKELKIDFSDKGMKLLKKKGGFGGKKTIYTNGKDQNGDYYLKAVADGSAGGIGMKLDKKLLSEMPYLSMTFKIQKDFERIDQTTRAFHDYTAKIVLGKISKIGSKVVSLAHSSFLDEGFSNPSPWTSGSVDVIVSSDNSKSWHTKKVNVRDILKKIHDIEFTTGIIFFTDSNNSGQKVIAYYKNIIFSSE